MEYFIYIKDHLVGHTKNKDIAYKLADALKDDGYMHIRVDEVES